MNPKSCFGKAKIQLWHKEIAQVKLFTIKTRFAYFAIQPIDLQIIKLPDSNTIPPLEGDYTGSYPNVEDCPKGDHAEYAFIGRSNVGKSSLINMLTGRKKLALVSRAPGKTQTINYFWMENSWHLVDLPGYGYAKVSKTMRRRWQAMIRNYLVRREQMKCVFLLIDGSIAPQQIDLEFADWLGEMFIPFVLVYTKTDKLPKTARKAVRKQFHQAMLKSWDKLPAEFSTSSKSKAGRFEMLNYIRELNKQHKRS